MMKIVTINLFKSNNQIIQEVFQYLNNFLFIICCDAKVIIPTELVHILS